jgi:hypothetical protein
MFKLWKDDTGLLLRNRVQPHNSNIAGCDNEKNPEIFENEWRGKRKGNCGKIASPNQTCCEYSVRDAKKGFSRASRNVIIDKEGQVISRADFAYPKKKIAVYVDGYQYHSDPERWQKDLEQMKTYRNRMEASSFPRRADIEKPRKLR